MIRGNDLVKKHYVAKPIATSDTHAKYNYARNTLGLSRSRFPIFEFDSDQELKDNLLKTMHDENFDNHLEYLSSFQFGLQLCFPNPPKGFP